MIYTFHSESLAKCGVLLFIGFYPFAFLLLYILLLCLVVRRAKWITVYNKAAFYNNCTLLVILKGSDCIPIRLYPTSWFLSVSC